MSLAALLISFVYLLLEIAVVILVAWAILWVLTASIGIAVDGNVLRWGKVVVGLVCLLLVVTWLFSVLGGTVTVPHFPVVR